MTRDSLLRGLIWAIAEELEQWEDSESEEEQELINIESALESDQTDEEEDYSFNLCRMHLLLYQESKPYVIAILRYWKNSYIYIIRNMYNYFFLCY